MDTLVRSITLHVDLGMLNFNVLATKLSKSPRGMSSTNSKLQLCISVSSVFRST